MSDGLSDARLNEIESLAHLAHELSAERRVSDDAFAYSYIFGNPQDGDVVRVSSNHPKDVHFLHMARRDLMELLAEVKRLRARR